MGCALARCAARAIASAVALHARSYPSAARAASAQAVIRSSRLNVASRQKRPFHVLRLNVKLSDVVRDTPMAYNCRVYRILIASPSDVEDEREIAVRLIQEWNDLYSYSRKVALLPLRCFASL